VIIDGRVDDTGSDKYNNMYNGTNISIELKVDALNNCHIR
jgi:hypothetical protein